MPTARVWNKLHVHSRPEDLKAIQFKSIQEQENQRA
jgi:hypothetical protein